MVGIVNIISKKTNLAKCAPTQLFLLFYGCTNWKECPVNTALVGEGRLEGI